MSIGYPVPPFPTGRHINLPGRGATFIRELEGPPGAPTLVLLHGWLTTGGLNWRESMPELAKRYHVVAMDLRGHGRGLRSADPFTYEECADDVAALIDVLGTGPAVLGGYSMGGPIAEVVWQRHPDRVGGLVLVSTTGKDQNNLFERLLYPALRTIFRHLPGVLFTAWWVPDWMSRSRFFRPVDECGHSDARRVVEAGEVAGTYDVRSFQQKIDVPTAVVVSARDLLVPPAEQRAVAAAIPHATTVTLQGGHWAFLLRQERFAAAVNEAAGQVAGRLAPAGPARRASVEAG